ncbi:UDP-N-acetylmuramate dehydrogenase [Adhaeribacter pallidiroseus]|uniref:UDP-N-acetylenolpyruvoylglucosamine reductase n=1 Tax=Adhaeribacter pallidiroseus TaxID=2072847 RepID=A0A369QFI1_9BACT|nr:UDP-N-acetylmuramate dehydrogenase [Adhaeribacter pallidiroseus]RDC63673.1 UDP-N-acetylmuramate dehydrogenase [Adhaeribacter pallidiroseus]
MELQRDISLRAYNTFGMDVKARFFATFSNVGELQDLLRLPELQNLPHLILGGGSNILFTQDFEGVVLKNNILGIETTELDADYYLVKASSGVAWHDLVVYTLEQELGGLENLSLIPGTVGAAPLQNIGAYGVELKDVFESLEAVHLASGELQTFNAEQCKFGYRESIFKHELKGQYIVVSVTLRLRKKPVFNTSYGAITQTLVSMQVVEINARAISEAVCQIRRSKLPDPTQIGNAGSFFKNPEISITQFQALQQDYPTIPSYPTATGQVKVPAGWLIEQAGWKGRRFEAYGVHKDQALVLVNYGGAQGNQVKDLAHQIIASVQEKFGIQLQPEVNII